MTTDDQIEDEKLQYDINRETAKTSVISSGKNEKYKYFTGEETLSSNQKQIREQAKFTFSPLEKSIRKKNKNNWRSKKKNKLMI